jgi:hypothetical protein
MHTKLGSKYNTNLRRLDGSSSKMQEWPALSHNLVRQGVINNMLPESNTLAHGPFHYGCTSTPCITCQAMPTRHAAGCICSSLPRITA